MKPVIYLAFSDHTVAALPKLQQEQEEILNALRDPIRKGKLEVVVRQSVSAEQLFNDLESYQDRIAIIHFGGHADGEKLLFGEEPAKAAGLAKAFGMQKRLKLVFLNGCSTYEQEKLLAEAEVPLTIATSEVINDDLAAEFAIRFYRVLATRGTIAHAFEVAVAWMKQKQDTTPVGLEIRSYRHLEGVGAEKPDAPSANLNPWNLYRLDPKATLHRLWPKYTVWQKAFASFFLLAGLSAATYWISLPPKSWKVKFPPPVLSHLIGAVTNWDSIPHEVRSEIYLSLDSLVDQPIQAENGSFRFEHIPAYSGTGALLLVIYQGDTIATQWVELPGPEDLRIPQLSR